MKITFTGYSQTEKETELSAEELQGLMEVIKKQFLVHIEYTPAYERSSRHRYPEEQFVIDLCKNHGIDLEYRKDRVAFFNSILEKLKINVRPEQ